MATTALHLTGTTGKPWSFSPKDEAAPVISYEPDPSFFVAQVQSHFPRASAIDRSSFGFSLVIPPWFKRPQLLGG